MAKHGGAPIKLAEGGKGGEMGEMGEAIEIGPQACIGRTSMGL
jgi:hypothetical protein